MALADKFKVTLLQRFEPTLDMSNLSLILYPNRDLKLEKGEIPQPGPKDVQLRIEHVSICGSDIACWQKGGNHGAAITKPIITGHEASGVVTVVGSEVKTLKVGDRVAVDPNMQCRECAGCVEGRLNLCDGKRYCASPPDTDGLLSKYVVHPELSCHKLPAGLSLETAALLQPLAVSIHSTRRGGVTLGHKVLICGAGCMGAMHIGTARLRGASVICVTDVLLHRLQLAKSLGADHVILVTNDEDPKETAVKVKAAMGSNADVSIECSAAPQAKRYAIYATKPGGTVVYLGFGPEHVELPIVYACLMEIDIKGTIGFLNDYPAAISVVTAGHVNPLDMVTHHFSMDQSLEAFEVARRQEGLKVIINVQK